MNHTSISWTELTWNPVTGCTHCGTGECDNCYARGMAIRLRAMHNPRYANGFTPTPHPEALGEPLATNPKKKIMCFLPSMGDLFHKDIPDVFINKVIDVVEMTPWITYQILTKRSARMAAFFNHRRCPANVWLGVTCGCKDSLFRVDDLRGVAAPVRFVSAEPLLSDLANEGLDLIDIDWIIAGGERAPKAAVRRMREDWVLNLKNLSDANGTAFFFKQWGNIGPDGIWRHDPKINGDLLGGVNYHNYPTPRVNY